MAAKVALLIPFALLAGCGSEPSKTAAKEDCITCEPWYSDTTRQVAKLAHDATDLLQRGKPDDAAALISKGQPLIEKLMSVPQPTLEATQAASDLDELYGRMLLSNGNIGWARLFFQKNVARWKNRTPQTPDTERRLKQAEAEIAECDKKL